MKSPVLLPINQCQPPVRNVNRGLSMFLCIFLFYVAEIFLLFRVGEADLIIEGIHYQLGLLAQY